MGQQVWRWGPDTAVCGVRPFTLVPHSGERGREGTLIALQKSHPAWASPEPWPRVRAPEYWKAVDGCGSIRGRCFRIGLGAEGSSVAFLPDPSQARCPPRGSNCWEQVREREGTWVLVLQRGDPAIVGLRANQPWRGAQASAWASEGGPDQAGPCVPAQPCSHHARGRACQGHHARGRACRGHLVASSLLAVAQDVPEVFLILWQPCAARNRDSFASVCRAD